MFNARKINSRIFQSNTGKFIQLSVGGHVGEITYFLVSILCYGHMPVQIANGRNSKEYVRIAVTESITIVR